MPLRKNSELLIQYSSSGLSKKTKSAYNIVNANIIDTELRESIILPSLCYEKFIFSALFIFWIF